MVDASHNNRVMSTLPSTLSSAQRAFVDAAETLGATAPAAARALTELPRLSAGELDDLVELGLVREAIDWRYYVFRSRRRDGVALHALQQAAVGIRQSAPSTPRRFWHRFWGVLLFWVLIILIPIVFLLSARR